MDRRDFLKLSASGAALAAAESQGPIFAQIPSERPNIFMIFSDDTPKRDFGCYGNNVVRTPRIDRLASEGMRLDNVYTGSPTCVPSRTCLYTGLYPIRNGAHPNWSSVKPGTKSLPHYLKALGYRVLLLGKKHLWPWDSFPFEYHDDDIGSLGPGEDLQRILAEPGDQPWCIVMCKFSAHVPWPHNNTNYKTDQMDIPPDHVDTPQTRDLRCHYYSKITEMDEAVGKVLDLLDRSGNAENTLTIYTADHGTDWPKQKWNLYDAGINVPFIARWPGKIKPGSSSDALISYVDILPTFVDVAGGDVSKLTARVDGAELDGESFLPVLAGETQDHHAEIFACFTWGVMEAYPMRAVRTKTHKYIWNIDSHFRYQWPPDTGWWGESQGPMALTPWAAHGWSMARSWLEKAKTDPAAADITNALQFRPPVELYNVREDPYEMNNLAQDPDQQQTLASLRAKLDAWMQQQGDTGDSAYHKEAHRDKRFLDEFYGRQVVINVRMYPGPADPITKTLAASVQLTCPVWRAEIRYTLDGSEPTRNSTLYTEMFHPLPPVTIKAKGFFEGGETPVKVVAVDDVDFRFHYQYHFKPESW